MKKLLFLSLVLALLACSNQGGVDNSQQPQALDTAALVGQVQDIYASVFQVYEHTDFTKPSLADDSSPLDSLMAHYCSSDWQHCVTDVLARDASQGDGMVGFFEADYWIMGQDWQDLSVSDVNVKAMTDSTATVELNLHNCGNVIGVCLEMVNDGSMWKIDNFIDVTNHVDWKANMKAYLNQETSNATNDDASAK